MPSSNAPDIAPDYAILINEAAAATGVTARKINRLIDDKVLPRSVCLKVGNRRALRAFALPMVSFAAADGAKLSKGVRLEAMHLIEKFAKEHWSRLRDEPKVAELLRFESGCVVVSLGKAVSEAMRGLNKWDDARMRVVEDAEVRGGIPVMRGTRIGVYEAADALAGDGMDVALADFPSLSRADMEAAALYATTYPRTGRPRTYANPCRLVWEEVVDRPVVA